MSQIFELQAQEVTDHNNGQITLELTVRNHPGVMSHVCGLFARRAYNVEGILCMPIGQGEQSRIWLVVKQDQRLEQMLRQVQKLQDVIDVRCNNANRDTFEQLERFFRTAI